MEEITNRFIEVYNFLLKEKNVLNAKDFALKIGISPSFFNEITKGRSEVGVKALQNTVQLFQNINIEWLISGKGSLQINSTDELESVKPIENWKLNTKSIPLIPIEAIAGVGSEGFYSINLNEIEERYYIPLFENKGIDFVSPVRGNSMYPMFSSGDVVGCKFVNSILFFQWGQVYLLDTISQGPLLKQVFKAPDSTLITCHSINTIPYPDFEVPLSDIRSLSLVMGSVRLQ